MWWSTDKECNFKISECIEISFRDLRRENQKRLLFLLPPTILQSRREHHWQAEKRTQSWKFSGGNTPTTRVVSKVVSFQFKSYQNGNTILTPNPLRKSTQVHLELSHRISLCASLCHCLVAIAIDCMATLKGDWKVIIRITKETTATKPTGGTIHQ